MVKAVTVAGLLFAATLHFACSPFGGASAFTCDEDADCQGGGQAGRCELSTSFCAFDDAACGPNGRYGSLAGGLSNQCVDGTTTDGGVDAEPDGMPPNPDDVCFGVGGLESPCWAPTEVPDQAISITANTTIDTTTSLMCSTTVKNSTACVVAGSTITISGGSTLRAIGTKPLVLVATTGAIQIDGVVDVASHVTLPPAAAPGAGANFAACDPGTLPNNGGGGAGGSFGSLGGNGGVGRNVGASNGTAGAAQTPAALRGGCKGQDGNGAANFGIGADSGGTVYLIGQTAINVAAGGVINASGAGAIDGFTGGSVGGGGGGSGGLIGLHAPTIANAGNVFANGGGGGEASGNNTPVARMLAFCGADPTGIGAAAGGSGGTNSGGDGGAGGAGATGGVTGANGINNGGGFGGGGGGGGGTGVIKVFGGGTLAGNRSPAPS